MTDAKPDLAALPLRHVVVVTPTREGVNAQTRKCIWALEELGAGRLDLAGCSDVALARNLLLTSALERSEPHRTVFLLVDDDMVFSTGDAQLIVERALSEAHPVSAVYATSSLALAHSRRPDGRWWSGLGFMAVRRDKLQELADKLPTLQAINRTPIKPFCQCRPNEAGDMWLSEDWFFSEAMGGVILHTIGVAHLKRMPIEPDAHTLNMVSHPDAAEQIQRDEAKAKAADEAAAE